MQEKVADVQYGTGHSPFANYLLKVLNENKSDLLVGSLVEKVSTAVANNSKQIPIGKPIQGAGDEGGQFVFELKK
jgi:hypothetical protein